MRYGIPKLKLGRDIYVLLASVLILHLGLYVVIPILPVILRVDKGLNPAQIGIIIGAGSIAIQAGSLVGGLLADRIGRKTTMVIGALFQAIGLFGFGVVSSFFLLLGASMFNGIGSGIYSPTVKAAIASIASRSAETRTTAFSLRGTASNIGVSLAGGAIFFLARLDSRISFFVAGCTFLALSLFSWIFLPKDCGGEECPLVPLEGYRLILKNKAFMLFTLVSALIWVVYSQLSLLLPLRGEAVLANGKMVGTIWTVTSLLAILSQGVISKHVLQKTSPLTSVFLAVLLLGAGVFAVGLSNSFILLTLSAVIFLVGEMLLLPTTDSITSQLSDSELVGAYFSIAGLVSGFGTALGNFIGGQLISTFGIAGTIYPWLIIAVLAGGVALTVLALKRVPVIKSKIQQQT